MGILILLIYHLSSTTYIFIGPEFLTVSSSGPAGKEQDSRMGVYRQSGETHNKKPVWSRHYGPEKLFYSDGMFFVKWMMMIVYILQTGNGS